MGGKPDAIKAMAITKRASFAEGTVNLLEGIITAHNAQRMGCAEALISGSLIDAWEHRMSGYAWRTGLNNTPAISLFQKIAPSFTAESAAGVWNFSRYRKTDLLKWPTPEAHVATLSDLDMIAQNMKGKPSIQNIAEIMQEQEIPLAIGRLYPFVVASDQGAFAISSRGYSPSEITRKINTRVYIPDNFERADIFGLVKKVAIETTMRRRWSGPIHVEICNDLTERDLRRFSTSSKSKIVLAESALQELGAERPTFGTDEVGAYHVSGKEFVGAVMNAINQPYRPYMSQDGFLERLAKVAKEHQLEFSPAH